MREFSSNERRVIKLHLVAGTGLSGMLSDNFRLKSKLLITYKTNDHHRFIFESDVLGKDAGYEELIDLIHLLQYLLTNGLIIAYPLAATVIRRYGIEDETISLGDGNGFLNQTWLPSKEDGYIGDFVKRHENSFFKATEPLVSLSNHNWQTWDERKHKQGIYVAIGIAILTSIITAAGIWFQYYKSYSDLQDRIDNYNLDLQQTKEKQIDYEENYAKQIDALNNRIDSLKAVIPKQKKKN